MHWMLNRGDEVKVFEVAVVCVHEGGHGSLVSDGGDLLAKAKYIVMRQVDGQISELEALKDKFWSDVIFDLKRVRPLILETESIDELKAVKFDAAGLEINIYERNVYDGEPSEVTDD